jgi:predicted PurR-regulated permease PerM
MAWLGNFGLEEQARALVRSPQDLFDTQQLVSMVQAISGQAISFITTCTLVLVLMTFMLGEARLFKKNLHKLPSSSKGKEDFTIALNGIQRYLFIKTIASATTGSRIRSPRRLNWAIATRGHSAVQIWKGSLSIFKLP